MKHFRVTFEPDKQEVSVHAGATLLEAAGRAGIILDSACGGKGACRKCLVKLMPDRREVLACQYGVQSDLAVIVPDTSRLFEQKILAEGISPETKILPDIYRKYAQGNTGAGVFGLAVDVGTSTVVAKIIDMATGHVRGTESAGNPQVRFGDDVVSRIGYGQTDEKLAEMRKVIIDCVNGLILRLCEKTGRQANDIYEMAVVGNTTMNHMFLGLPIAQLGQAPYKAFSLESRDCSPGQLSVEINPEGNIHTVENIAGFVGSDTTAVALATEIDAAQEVTLAIDIGTNGELVLAAGGRLYAASCAAGPAFEGARIGCGSRAVEGAIQGVIENDGDIDLDVIGGRPARSICGSGLIDAAALMLDFRIVEASGRFGEPEGLAGKLPPAVFSRIIDSGDQRAFVLAWGRETGREDVILTQADIRQVQLAKGAIRAGTRLLLKKVGIEECDVRRVLLAGAFGNYIRRQSALRIGLLPNVPSERIRFVGNAACSGAEMVLVSSNCRAHAGELARRIQYVEIAHEKDFADIFAESMAF